MWTFNAINMKFSDINSTPKCPFRAFVLVSATKMNMYILVAHILSTTSSSSFLSSSMNRKEVVM